MRFEEVVKRWAKAQRDCLSARIAYERAYAEALIRADGKSAEIRKAQADLAALAPLKEYELAAIEAKALELQVEYLKQGAAA